MKLNTVPSGFLFFSIHRFALVLAFALLSARAAAEPLDIPASCRQSPTADCLVTALTHADFLSDNTFALSQASASFVKAGKYGLNEDIRRLLRKTNQASLNHPADLQAISQPRQAIYFGVRYDEQGFDSLAEQYFQRAFSLMPNCMLTSDYSERSQKNNAKMIAGLYASIADDEVRQGRPQAAKSVLARMKTECAFGVSAEDLADIAASTLERTDPDAALALVSIEPEPRHDASMLIWLDHCINEHSQDETATRKCSRWISEVKGAWNSAAGILAMPTDGTDAALRRALAAAEKAYLERPGGWSPMMSGGFRDLLVRMAQKWLSLDQPTDAVRVLDERRRRPDIFTPAMQRPTDDYAVYAKALVRLGRVEEALSLAAAAKGDFEARSGYDVERLRSSIHNMMGVDDHIGDKTYLAVLDELAEVGQPDQIRDLVPHLPATIDKKTVDRSLVAALLAADRQAEAEKAMDGWPKDEVDRYLTAHVTAIIRKQVRAGEDSRALDSAMSQLNANGSFSGFLYAAREQKALERNTVSLATLRKAADLAVEKSNDDALGMIAVAQATQGDFEVAWVTLSKTSPKMRDYYLMDIVKREVASDRRRDAVAHALTASTERQRNLTVLAVAATLD